MAYDSYNYDIKSKLPEWWRHDTFLEPINRYTQEVIRDIIGGLLGSFGVVQPFNVWKTLPTEYSWTHTYLSHDSKLRYPEGGTSPLTLYPDKPVYAYIPDSKRNCHGTIHLQLQGDQQGLEKPLEKITIKNANQTITIKNITTSTNIEIFTEDGTILIDGVKRDDLVEGSFHKIYPQAQNPNYDEVEVYDENKITYISLESSTIVNFSLKAKLIHPVYVTEQNIRVHTVSAFPIEWIKLYGFYCHEFNNKQEWCFLWEKYYTEDERVVYDRITKQFDCETFYIQVKLYGIGLPFTYGFPQESLAINPAFQANTNLDKWGKIYGLPRRYYKTRISEDEEPYTYPPFYTYDIEQDYWYEERLVNEYKHNTDAINAALVKDTNYNNIAILKCIDPSINDIYVYTETIKNTLTNAFNTDNIYPTDVFEEGDGVKWENPQEASRPNTTNTEVELKPQSDETINTGENKSKVLALKFDNIPELPKNIEITGLELQLNGLTDIHSDALKLDDRSQMLLPVIYSKLNKEVFKTTDHIPINNDFHYWEKGKGTYIIGGPNDLFNVPEIKRNQLQDGIAFQLGFTNTSTFLKATIALYSVKLIIHYKKIYDSYDMKVEFDKKQIILDDPDNQSISMKIKFNNTGKIPAVNKSVYIATATGINITNKTFPVFDLDVGEEFIIGENNADKIIITPTEEARTGLYDIIVFCDEKSIKDTITIKQTDIQKDPLQSILSIDNNRFYIEDIIKGQLQTKEGYPIKDKEIKINLTRVE